MSADFGTEHYKGYLHDSSQPGREPYIHVTQAGSGSDYAVGDFSLADIAELAEMAGQAWPDSGGVEVRYVIEARRGYDGTGTNPSPWQEVWGARADDHDSSRGVSEEYATATFDGLQHGQFEWRLVRRTTVTAEEILLPDPGDVAAVLARLEADGARFRAGRVFTPGPGGNDTAHDYGLGENQDVSGPGEDTVAGQDTAVADDAPLLTDPGLR